MKSVVYNQNIIRTTKKKPLISVVIPIYNEEKYIYKCLISVKKQLYKPIEIIVVDDGSTDNSYNIAKKFNIKIFKIKHSGAAKARNYGIKNSFGEILVFMDADTIYDKEYINNLVYPIINNISIGTFSTTELIGNTDKIWSNCWNINIELPISKRITSYQNNDGKVFRAIIKKEIERIGGYDETCGYYEDHSFSNSGLRAYPVKTAVCYHYNPDTLKDVFISARWIGRSTRFPITIRNILKYSIFNSLKVSFWRIGNGAPLLFVLFKIIFDFGMLNGILFKNSVNFNSK